MSLDINFYIEGKNVHWQNITHNLNAMASAGSIYKCLWRQEELGITRAGELINPLIDGIKWMKEHPAECMALEPESKWGTYRVFVPWLEKLLEKCIEYPTATIET